MKKIAVGNSRWANIGDAFYRNAVVSDLQLAFGEKADIFSVDEYPVHALNRWGGRKAKFFDYSLFTEADWYVISGPIFSPYLPARFEKLFSELKARGTKIVMISVGSSQYDQREIDLCRQFLQRYPPYILSSRDSKTYRAYSDLAEHSYDGICSAFYSSIHFAGYSTCLDPYIICGFEDSTEPTISISDTVQNIAVDCSSMRKLGTWGRIIDNFRKYPGSIDGYTVIRPMHHPLAKFSLYSYNRPNKFISLNPYSYINLFKNAEITISQRVHACVPTLSYQKPAMLVKNTKRSALFDRLGLQDITKGPVSLAKEKLLEEHSSFTTFLESIRI